MTDLFITVPGVTRYNANKFTLKLSDHGIIREVGQYAGGHLGDRKCWRLVCDTGPNPPDVCPNCGKRITQRECKREE